MTRPGKLFNVPNLSYKQKLAYFKNPDWCFVTSRVDMPILLNSLQDLIKHNFIYYSTYEIDTFKGLGPIKYGMNSAKITRNDVKDME